ncbi:hypothetical protein, partial [uncultured Bacteroides sp.]|uniref:hypothetical protein n=1 Tax=uncultured Bacteroides sp. TaxID=162156 RepID=UPI0025B6EBB3
NLLVIQQKSILHISCGTGLVNTIRDCPSTVISSRNIVFSKLEMGRNPLIFKAFNSEIGCKGK